MKKILFLFITAFFIFAVKVSAIAMPPDYVVPPQDPVLLGQNNYYSLFFRGNGEVVVSLKSQFTNTTGSPISTIKYILPSPAIINNIIAYQAIPVQRSRCLYPTFYKQGEQGVTNSESLSAYITPTVSISNPASAETKSIMPCYEEPYAYGMYSRNTFERADYQQDRDKLVITLPKPVAANSYVSFFLSYRTFGYTRKDYLGVYTYSFNTLKSELPVDSISIGISTEQDYRLKEAKGQVNYGTAAKINSIAPLPSGSEENNDLYTRELTSYYDSIGQGAVYKYASHLAPLETYSVTGAYTDKAWKFYVRDIAIGLLVAILLILIFALLIKKISKGWRKAGVNQAAGEKKSIWSRLSNNQRSLAVSIAASIVGATCAIGYTLLLYFISNNLLSRLGYMYGFEQIIFIILLLISLGAYITFVFLPAVVIAVRRGIFWGIGTFIFTFAWLFIYLIITIILFASMNSPVIYPASGAQRILDKVNTVEESYPPVLTK